MSLSRLADMGQRTIVAGLIGATLFLGYSSFQQTANLVERRKMLNARLRELEEQGVVPEGTSEGKNKGLKLDMKTMEVTYNDEVLEAKK